MTAEQRTATGKDVRRRKRVKTLKPSPENQVIYDAIDPTTRR